MPSVVEQKPENTPRGGLHLAEPASPSASHSGLPDDGTRQLLTAGAWTIATGVVAALLTTTVLGGISRQGPHTNLGWLALLVALMCLPFGSMLFALGAAKWFRTRRLQNTRNNH